jgi:hypothetical protein
VDEARDPWRKETCEPCLLPVEKCKTPGEAARRLNAALFAKVKVRYSSERKKPQQSPKESMLERGDPRLAFTCQVTLKAKKK